MPHLWREQWLKRNQQIVLQELVVEAVVQDHACPLLLLQKASLISPSLHEWEKPGMSLWFHVISDALWLTVTNPESCKCTETEARSSARQPWPTMESSEHKPAPKTPEKINIIILLNHWSVLSQREILPGWGSWQRKQNKQMTLNRAEQGLTWLNAIPHQLYHWYPLVLYQDHAWPCNGTAPALPDNPRHPQTLHRHIGSHPWWSQHVSNPGTQLRWPEAFVYSQKKDR